MFIPVGKPRIILLYEDLALENILDLMLIHSAALI